MQPITIIEGADDEAVAAWLAPRLAAALAQGEHTVAVALPGGSTPFPILKRLNGHDLDWKRLHIYPTDDRLVPETHEASNTGRLRALLEPLGARVHSLAELLDAGKGRTGQGVSLPRFALVWLGMGSDGHVASLFPNTDPRAGEAKRLRRLTPDPLPPEAPFDRVTLTMPALLDCEEMMFVVRGADKRPVLDDAIAGRSDLPIARLLAARGEDLPVTCFT